MWQIVGLGITLPLPLSSCKYPGVLYGETAETGYKMGKETCGEQCHFDIVSQSFKNRELKNSEFITHQGL